MAIAARCTFGQAIADLRGWGLEKSPYRILGADLFRISVRISRNQRFCIAHLASPHIAHLAFLHIAHRSPECRMVGFGSRIKFRRNCDHQNNKILLSGCKERTSVPKKYNFGSMFEGVRVWGIVGRKREGVPGAVIPYPKPSS